MIKFLATLRNVLVVIILSWLGFSEAPKDKQSPDEDRTAPTTSLFAY